MCSSDLVLSKGVGDVDEDLLLDAVDRLLQNDDGRARAAAGTIYKILPFERLVPLLPRIVESVRTPSPSGVMFANGIRLAGLDLLSEHGVAEGIPLCVEVTEIDEWGKQDRVLRAMKAVARYGAAARSEIPRLRDLKQRLEAHREAKNLGKQIEAVEAAMHAIESAPEGAPARTVAELLEAAER